jgi:hypothetical protein
MRKGKRNTCDYFCDFSRNTKAKPQLRAINTARNHSGRMHGAMKKIGIWEDAGKLLLDIGKLTFGSFILGGVLRGNVPWYMILIVGAIVSTVCISVGLVLAAKGKE